MTSLITAILLIFALSIGKYHLGKWFNHISLYSIIWAAMVFTYEMRLISYVEITNETFLIIFIAFLTFLTGSLIPVYARKLKPAIVQNFGVGAITINQTTLKVLDLVAVIALAIALFSAFHSWYVLINKFGSIAKVLINANKVYSLRVDNQITGTIPYLPIFGHVAIILGAIITAVKNRLTITTVLAVIAVIISELSLFGRYGILIALFEVIFGIILTRNLLLKQNNIFRNYKKRRNITYGIVIVIVIAVFGASTVKSMRGSVESFKASSKILNTTKTSGFSVVSPSIYLYISSQIVVLSEYIKSDSERNMIGQSTFMPVYNFLSKFNFVPHPDFYMNGYYIPMWSNTATYLREVHADFGIFGVFIVPFIIGLFSTSVWLKCYDRHSLPNLILLIFMHIVIVSTFVTIATRVAFVLLSMLFLLTLAYILESKSKTRLFKEICS